MALLFCYTAQGMEEVPVLSLNDAASLKNPAALHQAIRSKRLFLGQLEATEYFEEDAQALGIVAGTEILADNVEKLCNHGTKAIDADIDSILQHVTAGMRRLFKEIIYEVIQIAHINARPATDASVDLAPYPSPEAPDLRKFTHLIHLNLAGNNLVTIDAAKLPTTIEFLNLSDNNFREPLDLRSLTHLATVCFTRNQLAQVAKDKMPGALTFLHLLNDATDEPDLNNLVRLKEDPNKLPDNEHFRHKALATNYPHLFPWTNKQRKQRDRGRLPKEPCRYDGD